MAIIFKISRAGGQKSEVSISVGEKNGFLYTVNGRTFSNKRITVSGNYFNDELHGDGWAHLFLGVDTGVYYTEYIPEPDAGALHIYVENFYGDQFYFTVLVPPTVSVVRDLVGGKFNDTAILINGPSRSARRYPRLAAVTTDRKNKAKVADFGNVPENPAAPQLIQNLN